jgi:uncharacterized integral membrane protein
MTDTPPTEAAHDPGLDHPQVPAAEPRTERVARHLHRARLYTGAVAFIALIAVLIVLISVNTRSVKLSWAFGSTHASLVWIILATAVVGWLLGLVTAGGFRRRTRRRK